MSQEPPGAGGTESLSPVLVGERWGSLWRDSTLFCLPRAAGECLWCGSQPPSCRFVWSEAAEGQGLSLWAGQFLFPSLPLPCPCSGTLT